MKSAMRQSKDRHARIPASIIGADLTMRQFRVYAALSIHKGGDGRCWPKLATLSRISKIHERHVRRTLAELEELGFVKRELRGNTHQTTIYTLFEPAETVELDDDASDWGEEGQISPPPGAKLAPGEEGQISPPSNITETQNIESQVSTETTAQAPGDPGINSLLLEIQEICKAQGWAYDRKDDRRMARHILTAKDFGAQAESCGLSPHEYALGVIKASAVLDFWRGKVSGPSAIYRHHAKIYNEAKEMKNRNVTPHFKTL